ncbi:MAG: hypothetical protein RMX65_031360 [Nostoc sp. DedQUE01]|nr:hypothetical protein [Nostoc sp. DedQUE11]MDZ8073464.1 hypothetical protein [Nostoc sp. DedQUE01]
MTFLILPKLKNDSDVRPSDKVGKWDAQPPKAFQDVASSLNYKSPGRVKSVSSVPTMWARPMSMEMALHNKAYPIREQMIEQWRGMLAAIALAEVRRLPLTAKLVDLAELRHKEAFARSLYELLPDPVYTLYTLDGKNPWQDIYVFSWDENPVGITTPSTLVVPSEEGKWVGLPWWNRRDCRLESPNNHLNASEKALLWRWLDNLRNELHNHKGETEAIDMIGGLLDEFRDSLGTYKEQQLTLTTNPQFFGVQINKGVLTAINSPVKAQPKASCVRLVPSPEKGRVIPELLIIDPEIAKAWGEVPQNIWIYEDQTLAALNIDDLQTGKILWRNVEWKESKDLFLPELTFIDLPDALPGAVFPNGTQINFNGQTVTPLIPLDPILLKYLTPEDLIKKVQFQSINGGDGPVVRIILDLPLSGVKNNDKQPQNYRIYKDYPLKEENALREVPVLEVWPHFRVEGWKEYYAFYYDGEFGEETFQVSLPDAQEPHIFQDGLGSYQIARLEEFPSYILCQNSARNIIGLMLLKTPEKIQPTGKWKVGVDFGTSFSNVYINRNGTVEPLPLQNLHLKVTDVQADTRNPVLFEYFIPESFIPAEKPLPLSSVLTKRGSKSGVDVGKERPIYDGRIYIPDFSKFKPEEDWIETDLKWKNLTLNRLFLKHLALHITALAAKKGVSQINWSLSYPSAFSKNDTTRYTQNWHDLTAELQAKTGIKHFSPELDNLEHLRTESLALAQYFADQEDYNLVNATCIDLGGGTSDISIWQNNNLIHQCSIQLAGRDLFSQFLELNPKFLEQRLEIKQGDWQGLEQGNFNAKLDVFMRWESEKWLKTKRSFVEEEADFQGLLRLIAMGFAGLYYYVGTILGVLYDEKKYTINEITPVYIGGNGSRLLHWLAIGGRFDRHSEVNQLLSRMLSQGSSFPDTEEITRLSTKPKDEVACGLVRERTKLQGLTRKTKDPIISGEDCEVNGQPISWKERLELDGNIEKFHVPEEMLQLRNFLDQFNLALKELEVDGLTPLPGYQPSQGIEANQRLWRDTYKELTRVTLEIKGDAKNIRPEPPFILGLKALMRVLGKEWAGK